jgi:hypothetical protein
VSVLIPFLGLAENSLANALSCLSGLSAMTKIVISNANSLPITEEKSEGWIHPLITGH